MLKMMLFIILVGIDMFKKHEFLILDSIIAFGIIAFCVEAIITIIMVLDK